MAARRAAGQAAKVRPPASFGLSFLPVQCKPSMQTFNASRLMQAVSCKLGFYPKGPRRARFSRLLAAGKHVQVQRAKDKRQRPNDLDRVDDWCRGRPRCPLAKSHFRSGCRFVFRTGRAERIVCGLRFWRTFYLP